MNNCAIVIDNMDSKTAASVKNFSDENVKEALAKILKIDASILKCQSSSMSYGIYSVEEIVPSLIKTLKPIDGLGFFDEKYPLIKVEYINFVS